MSHFVRLSALLLLCVFAQTSCFVPLAAGENETPLPIIFDTDIDTDCDDAGALAMLHFLADEGEVEILATLCSSHYAWSVPCIEAINTHFGRPDLPIGAPKLPGASDRRGSPYAKAIAERFPGKYRTNADAPDAVRIYRQILANAQDDSVVIVSVGYLT
ncbi:MAG: nucleoside hydrolase, partial [Planctomycetia bacterium]|nr:nucleoside hydrolase [Planctomycetia bacterium]